MQEGRSAAGATKITAGGRQRTLEADAQQKKKKGREELICLAGLNMWNTERSFTELEMWKTRGYFSI